MNEHADMNQRFMPLSDTIPVQVTTFNLLTGNAESCKIIDHNNSSDRKWLGSHCFWAFRNSRMVETRPI